MLVENAGELISKRNLISRVWPDTFLDGSNLKVNIAALRRALDEDAVESSHIVNVSGRGYRFVAPVNIREAENSQEQVNLHLQSREILVVEDTCKHVLCSAAEGNCMCANLVSKSLLERQDGGASRFRLLHLVRYFASKELMTRDNFGEEDTDRNRPFRTPLWATDRKLFIGELVQTVG